jgi:type IV pilus assembly protein PilC
MAQFFCRLGTPTGEIVERVLVADSEGALRRELESKDYLILDLRRRSPALAALGEALRLRGRVSAREFLFFNQELAALLRAGLPILTSLDILIERRKNPVFRRALADIRDRVKAGEALSDAFAAQGRLFPRLYAASLASGERSGEIPTVLKRYIAYSRAMLAVRRKVTSALVYPSFVVGVSLVVVGILVFYIVPRFRSFLEDFGVELPLVTQLLVSLSTTLVKNWKLLAGGLAAVVVAAAFWARTPRGRASFARLELRLPAIGEILHAYAQNRFTRTLGTLVAGGIPLVTALDLAARAVGNAFVEQALLRVVDRVREGHSLWESLEQTGLISNMAIEMVKVGESTGSLVEMLDSASDFAEEEIDHKLNRMVTLIEPLMIVFLAFMVAGMMMAIYLPLIRAVGQTRM